MIPRLVYAAGRVPLIQRMLRWLARQHREGSVATVRIGLAAGLKWKRYHRFASGYWLGIYEPDVQEAMARLLGPGDVFYDVGANAGFFSLAATRLVGKCGEVFAFEPLPENVDVLAQQVSLNNLSNVHLIRVAVGKTTGEAVLVQTEDSSTSHLAEEQDGRSLTVQLVSLDDFAKEHPPPDLAKIDVEGAEAQVLEGAQALIKDRPPAFLIELHSEGTRRQVFDILCRAGYELRQLDGKPIVEHGVVRHVMAYRERCR